MSTCAHAHLCARAPASVSRSSAACGSSSCSRWPRWTLTLILTLTLTLIFTLTLTLTLGKMTGARFGLKLGSGVNSSPDSLRSATAS